MNYYGKTGWTLALLVASFMVISPALKAADIPDSEQVSQLLSDAKTEAYQLKEDAATMHSFALTGRTWESHAGVVTGIKEHINAAGRQLAKLEDARNTASPWQQTAIDRIRPLLKELASNTQAVIEHLNKTPKNLNAPEYKDYLEANADQAEQLAGMIADFVNYGKTKQRMERLRDKLELPPSSGF